MMTILVLVALEEELPVTLPYSFVKVVTGLGKVNAAIATLEAINKYNPDEIINYGTAGTLNTEDYPSGLFQVGTVYQRDMDCTPIGYDIGQTPYDTEHRALNLGVKGPSLSTGDNFVTSEPELLTDLVDMEAYAIVKAARKFNIPVRVYKFVSDNANENASEDWNKNVANGYDLFLEEIGVQR